jgi:eukaryotic-like serine/threonine-protein kinase
LRCPTENTILAFALGDLSVEAAREVEDHIDDCKPCAELVADAARSVSGSHPASEDDAPETRFASHERYGSATDSTEPFSPGRSVGRYRILDSLGAGGMGVVYRAHDPELDREVALKLLRGAAGSSGSGGHARLLREAQLTAQLTHPNVVSVFEVGIEGGHVYLAMELVEGLNLRQWLKKPRTLDAVLEAFRQAAQGLCAAHRAGVIHRDFKPDNVLVGEHDRARHAGAMVGRVRVMDFGLARVQGSSELETEVLHASMSSSGSSMSDPLTATGTVMGTPAYMAPEQHAGLGDERSDQYAFFVSLYEALHGSRPFTGRSVTALAMHKQAGPPEIPARCALGKVPGWLRAIMRKGLEPDAALRHASMEAVVVALERGQHRTMRWAGAAAIGVLGTGAVGLAWAGTRSGVSCEGFSSQMDEIWGSHERAAMRNALLATGVAYADQTWTRVEERLDAWAEGWVEARVEACEAARDQGGDVAATARRACLEGRRAETAALIRVLSEADEAVATQAVRAVAALPSVAECAEETGEDLAAARIQADPEARALEDRLHEVAALGRAGRYPEALELARQAERDARALGHAPLLRRAHASLGEFASRLGEFDEAERALEEAYLAARALGDAPAAARAAASLAGLLGAGRSQLEEASKWLRHAQAELERYDAPPRARAMLHKVTAAVQMRAGEYDASLKEIQQGIELLRTELTEDDLLFSDYLNNLGNAYYALGRYEEAIEQHLRALAIREQELGDAHPQVGDSYGNLGAASFNLGRYEDSVRHHRRSLEIARASTGERSHDAAIVHNNLAGALHALHHHEEALEHYAASLEIWTKLFGEQDPHVALAENNVGNVYQSKGDCNEALEHFGRALDLRIAVHGREHPDVAVTLNNQASCLEQVGRIDEAQATFELALDIQERTLGPTHPDLGHALDNLAVILRERGRFGPAIAHHRRALEVRRAALGDAHVDVGNSRYGLGRALLESGDAAAAAPELDAALGVLEDVGAPAIDVAAARFALARALWASGEAPERARTLAQEARNTYLTRARDDRAEEVSAWLRSIRRADRPSPLP